MKQTQPYNIVLFSMSTYNEWQCGIVNRNHFIYELMEHDDRIANIFLVDYLPFNVKRGLKHILQNNFTAIPGKKIYKDFTTSVYKISDKTCVFSTSDSVFLIKQVMADIKDYLRELKITDFILWSYLPTFIEYFNLGQTFSVFDAVDNWIYHPAYQNIKDKLNKNYGIISQKADAIFTVAPDLLDLFGNQDKVKWIPNGVDFVHFQKPGNIPKELVNIKRPIIGYIGTIQSRVDLDLIKFIAEKNPDKSVVLIGPIWPDADESKLAGLNNVHLIGRIPYAKTPDYINQFAVGIVPHLSAGLVKTMNPMKIYEYLACGKPIVSTAMFGFDALSEFIQITDSYEEFNSLINQEILRDNDVIRQKRREAASHNSWQSRYEAMWQIIQAKLK